MRKTQIGEAAGFGVLVLGCLGVLADCGGGGGSNGNDPPAPDAGREPSDGSTVLKGGSDPEAGPVAGDADSPPQRRTCTTAASCPGSSEACCGGFCVDTSKDPNNCGKCGAACSAGQFCTGTACDEAIVANVCANAKGTVAADAYPEDTQAGAAMGTALTASCSPPTMILQTSQDAEGILDPGSGRPITGPGNTFITGGGGYGQNGVAYMETSITPVYLWGDGMTGQIRSRDGTALVNTTVADLTAHHDFFYVQVTVEPQSGTLCLSAVGMLGPGTQAAGYYAGAELIPNRAKYTSNWYVYEWQDANGDSVANAGDTFTLVKQGP
jgi:hypothetical protein